MLKLYNWSLPYGLFTRSLRCTAPIGLACLLGLPAAWADGPLRGNPLDSVPSLPAPDAAQRHSSAQLQPGDNEQRRQALAEKLSQTLTPRHFTVAGNTVVPLNQITPILEPLVGKPLTIAQLITQVDRITQIYQDRGYLLSFALLQNQDFKQGLVQVTVVEGHVNAIELQGNAGAAESRLQALATPLLQDKPLQRSTLERVLNLMRQVPGVRVQPQIELPKHAGGGTPLVLDVTRQALRAEGGASDLGAGIQPLISVVTGSLTPLGEQVRLTGAVPIGSHDVKYIAGEITVPIGHDGLALVLDGYHYEAQPKDGALYELGLNRRVVNERLGAGLRYPLLLDNRRSLTLEGGFYAARALDEYHRDSDNLWLDQRTDLRVLRAGLNYKDSSERQSREISLNVYRGLDSAGARKSYSTNASGQPSDLAFPARLDFTRYTLELNQSLVLPAGFGLTLSGFGQYTKDILPTMEQTSFGAWRYGLAYPQGDLAGDKGYGLSLELNRGFNTGWSLLSSIQPYIKVDRAQAWYNDPAIRDAANAFNPSLSSLALGARLTDNRRYIVDFNVAKPVGDLTINKDNRHPRFNINYSLLYDGW